MVPLYMYIIHVHVRVCVYTGIWLLLNSYTTQYYTCMHAYYLVSEPILQVLKTFKIQCHDFNTALKTSLGGEQWQPFGDRTEPIFVKEHITTNNYNFITASLTPLKVAVFEARSFLCVLCGTTRHALSIHGLLLDTQKTNMMEQQNSTWLIYHWYDCTVLLSMYSMQVTCTMTTTKVTKSAQMLFNNMLQYIVCSVFQTLG